MRRTLTVAIIALSLLPACGGTNRPEGVVERWLTSLNQGSAGRPGRYAPAQLSEQILPNWDDREPGELDVIEVGRSTGAESGTWFVPFRVVPATGIELRSIALVGGDQSGLRITALASDVPKEAVDALPSDGGPAIGGGGLIAWLAAIGVAVLFIVIAAGLMSFVRRPGG
jgi:hypothetical protein